MSEHVDPYSGEVLDFEPSTPVELEFMVRELSDHVDESTGVLEQLWKNRYMAEKEYISAKAKALLASNAATVTEKRAEAEIASLVQLQQFQDAKTILHAAEAKDRALRAKLSGYQSILKSASGHFNSYGQGRY